jgi:serine phosphatase RsbU (regulator of sigma subunit)/Tfp pilus assembly protein PilF
MKLRTRLSFLAIFFFSSFYLSAQNIDSLKQALSSARHDTIRCEILSSLAEIAPDGEWEKYNAQLLVLSEKNSKKSKVGSALYKTYQSYYSIALNNSGYIAYTTGKIQEAFEHYNKSIQISEQIGDLSGAASTLNNLGYIYKDRGEIEKALEHFYRSAELEVRSGSSKNLAVSLNNIGIVYDDKGELDSALVYYEKSLKIRQKIGDKDGIANSLNNIGMVYDSKGNVAKGLSYYFDCLKIREETGNKMGISLALNNIAISYKVLGDFKTALEYSTKSLKIREEIHDKKGMAQSLNSIGLIYSGYGDPSCKSSKQECAILSRKKALENHLKSLKLMEEVQDQEGIANTLQFIAGIYNKIGDPECSEENDECLRKGKAKALNLYLRSLTIYKEIEDKQGTANALQSIGHIYVKEKKYEKALEYLSQSMKLSKELGYPSNIKSSAKDLNIVFRAKGDYKSALENYELYIQMRDSLNNIETQKASIKQQSSYEYQQKKAIADAEHKAELKQQAEIARAEKKKQYIIIASVSIVLIVIIVFSVFLYKRFKITQRQKRVIEMKEKETHEQKLIIEEKHKEITDSINYAERIQRSFLATSDLLNQNLKDYFIFFKPKDVVSGDFYWAHNLSNGRFAFVTADSTGHGVPGAIMSLLNITSLEKAVEHHAEPAEILNSTRQTIIDRLKKDGTSEGGKDGMDCSLVSFDFQNLKLTYAAANNSVLLVRNKELTEFVPDKMPVGKHDRDNESFKQHSFDLTRNDVVYMITDGFPDQFGGPKGKKFMYKKLKELFVEISHLSMSEQEEKIRSALYNWKGDLEQVDDITVVGIRV